MPQLEDYERKVDIVKAFRWREADGAVLPYIEENVHQPGTYLANAFGGAMPISDGDWFFIDVDGTQKTKTDAEFNALYKKT